MLELADVYDTMVSEKEREQKKKIEKIRTFVHGYVSIVIEPHDVDDVAEVLGMSEHEEYSHESFLADQKEIIWNDDNYKRVKDIYKIVSMLDDITPKSCMFRRLKFFVLKDGMMWIF